MATPVCSIELCERTVFSKQVCQMHYIRIRNHGDAGAAVAYKELPKQKCIVEDCNNKSKHIKESYCAKHYARVQKYGIEGLHNTGRTSSIEESYWKRVNVGSEDDCWLWTGSKSSGGKKRTAQYGCFEFGGVTKRAHRVGYELAHHVELKSYEPVHHKCGNSLCQNPKHLQVITTHENTAEMLERNYYLKRIAELEQQNEMLLNRGKTMIEKMINESLGLCRQAEHNFTKVAEIANPEQVLLLDQFFLNINNMIYKLGVLKEMAPKLSEDELGSIEVINVAMATLQVAVTLHQNSVDTLKDFNIPL